MESEAGRVVDILKSGKVKPELDALYHKVRKYLEHDELLQAWSIHLSNSF